jgi:ribonuclease D
MMTKDRYYIANQKELLSFISEIKDVNLIAIDTEFVRRDTYYPILSIIQIAFNNNFYIIDCLSGIDISDLLEILANDKLIKIIHSSSQDLQILNHISNSSIAITHGVEDTQIMANFAGLGFNIGYSKLIAKTLNHTIDKKQQLSDWKRRPLNQKQIEYAFLDVKYLEEVHAILHDHMEKRGRTTWFREEMTSYLDNILKIRDEDLFGKFTFSNKSQKYKDKLKELILWREDMARKMNIPRQHLIKNETLEKIISNQDCSFLNLDSKLKQEINVILRSEYQPNINPQIFTPNLPLTEQQKDTYLRLKGKISAISKREDISEQFLITSGNLKKIALGHHDLSDAISGWRYELLGKEILNLL